MDGTNFSISVGDTTANLTLTKDNSIPSMYQFSCEGCYKTPRLGYRHETLNPKVTGGEINLVEGFGVSNNEYGRFLKITIYDNHSSTDVCLNLDDLSTSADSQWYNCQGITPSELNNNHTNFFNQFIKVLKNSPKAPTSIRDKLLTAYGDN